MLEQTSRFHYRSRIQTKRSLREWVIGLAAQITEFAFTREVSNSILCAADEKRVGLIALDNRYSKSAAKRNASTLIKERVDLAIEFQADEQIAPVISSMYREAGIPVIAIDIPHPGSTYFGADNYRAGIITLQIHAGGSMKAKFRNLKTKELH